MLARWVWRGERDLDLGREKGPEVGGGELPRRPHELIRRLCVCKYVRLGLRLGLVCVDVSSGKKASVSPVFHVHQEQQGDHSSVCLFVCCRVNTVAREMVYNTLRRVSTATRQVRCTVTGYYYVYKTMITFIP